MPSKEQKIVLHKLAIQLYKRDIVRIYFLQTKSKLIINWVSLILFKLLYFWEVILSILVVHWTEAPAKENREKKPFQNYSTKYSVRKENRHFDIWIETPMILQIL